MDQQIMEEFRRRNLENNAYYEEQIEDYLEHSDKKESFIKQFEKKFSEVEIYVQREAKGYPEFDCFLNFQIVPFICKNEKIARRKCQVVDALKTARSEFDCLLKENREIKQEDYNDTEERENKHIQRISKENNWNNKIDLLVELYNTKIQVLQKNIIYKKEIKKKLMQTLNLAKNNNQEIDLMIQEEREDVNKEAITKYKSIGKIKDNENKLKDINKQIKKMEIKHLTIQINDNDDDIPNFKINRNDLSVNDIPAERNDILIGRHDHLKNGEIKKEFDFDIHKNSVIDRLKTSGNLNSNYKESLNQSIILNETSEIKPNEYTSNNYRTSEVSVWDVSCIENNNEI